MNTLTNELRFQHMNFNWVMLDTCHQAQKLSTNFNHLALFMHKYIIHKHIEQLIIAQIVKADTVLDLWIN